MVYHRDVSWPIQVIRAIFIGRSWNMQNRFADWVSPRSYPKPALPGGVAHKAFDNYYANRDARRAVTPAILIYDPKIQIESGQPKQEPTATAAKLPPAPGNVYKWD